MKGTFMKENAHTYGSTFEDFLLRGETSEAEEVIPYTCARLTRKKQCGRHASRKKRHGKGAV
jgi:hypothetical protein